MKGGNAFFKEAISQLLTQQPSVAAVLQRITMQILRAIIRREQSNLEKKVTLVLMIVNMYRLLEPNFYQFCVQAVVLEYCAFDTQTKQQQAFSVLLSLLSDIDWKRKRFLPNAKEVIAKIQVATI